MLPTYKIQINPRAKNDIQLGIDYSNEKQKGLGKRFHTAVKSSFIDLKKNPFFQIRYDAVRCLPIKKFPFMKHFTVDENIGLINVYAVVNTYLDPETSWIK